MKAAGYKSKTALAIEIGTSEANVGRWCSGQIIATRQLLNRLAKALNLSPEDLVDDFEQSSDKEKESVELIIKVRKVLQSKTQYATALRMDIESLHAAVETEEKLNAAREIIAKGNQDVVELKTKVQSLEKSMSRI